MWRGVKASVGVCVLAAFLVGPERQALAQSVRADVSINTSGGYARLVFHFTEDVESDVRLSNGVLIIAFGQPVDVGVDRIADSEYFSIARRDPNGRGVRVALSRRVRINTMVAGERLFIDLLPDEWTGPAPSLPQEVVEDLSRRMREAERRSKQQRALERSKYIAVNRVKISRQPTFTRYVFELPDLIAVSTDRVKDKLTVNFSAALKFDLADVKSMQPQSVESLDVTTSDLTTTASFAFLGLVDVRTFREDNSFVVDILTPDSEAKRDDSASLGTDKSWELPPANSVTPQPGLAPVATHTRSESPVLRGSSTAAPAAPPERLAAAAQQIAPRTPPAAAVPAPAASESTLERAPDGEGPPAAVRRTAPVSADPAASPAVSHQLKEKPQQAPEVASLKASGESAISPTLKRQGEGLQLGFNFAAPTAAAMFTRADKLWLVFDGNAEIDPSSIKHEAVRTATVDRHPEYSVVGIKLDRPRLVSVAAEGSTWNVDIGDAVIKPSQPISVLRSGITERRASVQIPLDEVARLHRFSDPEIGDEIAVITAMGPPRGLPKTQDFVDFRALASLQGVVVQSIADDLLIEVATDRVWISRPAGLTLTSASPTGRRSGSLRPAMFDTHQWGFDRGADFPTRSLQLLTLASQAPEPKRAAARLDLVRFYFAHGMYPEAKGVLDVVLQDERASSDDALALVMRGIANIYMGRPSDALKDLNNPLVGSQYDAPLWRAVAAARQGRWPEAREGLIRTESAVPALPLEMQRDIIKEIIRVSVEVRDFASAESQLNELQALGSTADDLDMSILAGRIREGLEQYVEALASYRAAADSTDRSVAAQGRMHEVALRYRLGDLSRADVVDALETLTAVWRGDETEAEALQLLAKLYIEDGRYRDSFKLMRIALTAHPDSDLTRRIQDDAASTFDQLFLGGKGDALPAIEALSLFYDFRELTPIGRRGDEMIRRLADRLVAVDLLDQAAELLQHQVEHRLQGVARAQVATRLAIVHLLNRKPERALQVLKSTRQADLSGEIRNQRLMLEARALSDVGRHALAVDIAQNLPGPEAARLRSDILWAAKRYRESAEQIELLYSDRWQDWKPLNDLERRDILRAAISYAIAEDSVGRERFRERFAPFMAQGPDGNAFEVATSPLSADKVEFLEIVRAIAAVDTLDQFVRDIRARFPETPGSSPQG